METTENVVVNAETVLPASNGNDSVGVASVEAPSVRGEKNARCVLLWKEMGEHTSYKAIEKAYEDKYGDTSPSAITIMKAKKTVFPDNEDEEVKPKTLSATDMVRVATLARTYGGVDALTEKVKELEKILEGFSTVAELTSALALLKQITG